MNSMPTPTVADVDRIAALTDPVIRNLQITQCYYELSARLVQRTGPAANWCTFATWASKQAGQTIRQQDLDQALKRALTNPPAMNALGPTAMAAPAADATGTEARRVDETLWAVLDPTAPFDRASAAVARGNLKVFAEIGRLFAAFAATCLDDPAYDAAKITGFCAELRPGPPPDGQEYLRLAFASYYTALFATAPKERAERLLFANLAIGYHEQTRLQPEIVAALDAPIADPGLLTQRLLAALLPYPGGWRSLGCGCAGWWGGRCWWSAWLPPPSGRARELAHAIVTEHLMTLTFPGGAYLRLGRDLRADFPVSLQQIDDTELKALLARVDPTPDSIAGNRRRRLGRPGRAAALHRRHVSLLPGDAAAARSRRLHRSRWRRSAQGSCLAENCDCALGYRNLGDGEFTLRTLYNFQQRLSQHMQATGENLLDAAFAQFTGQQMQAFQVHSSRLRMDSTQIASDIRETSRLQLLVEVLQHVARMLAETDNQHYAAILAPYVQGSAGQYLYRLQPAERPRQLEVIGGVMHQLASRLAAKYAQAVAYPVLVRVFHEHFVWTAT